MTSVLQNLRQLEAAHRRGDLKDGEYNRLRAEMMDAIEDAAVFSSELNTPASVEIRPTILGMLTAIICGCSAITFLGYWITGDISLALTIAAMVLAALTVGAFRHLGE